jgi:hypothetical protein
MEMVITNLIIGMPGPGMAGLCGYGIETGIFVRIGIGRPLPFFIHSDVIKGIVGLVRPAPLIGIRIVDMHIVPAVTAEKAVAEYHELAAPGIHGTTCPASPCIVRIGANAYPLVLGHGLEIVGLCKCKEHKQYNDD